MWETLTSNTLSIGDILMIAILIFPICTAICRHLNNISSRFVYTDEQNKDVKGFDMFKHNIMLTMMEAIVLFLYFRYIS